MSAFHRNLILFALAFLTGVWVGQGRLISWQSEDWRSSKASEKQTSSHQSHSADTFRTMPGNRGATPQKRNGDKVDNSAESGKLKTVAHGFPAASEAEDMASMQEIADGYKLTNENLHDTYSALVQEATDNIEIAPLPQSLEEDIVISLQDGGIPAREINDRVENIMGMITQADQQTPESYPHFSAQ
jgi:hypothetical protein